MLICRVVGHVWATKKEDSMCGMKLMVVQELNKAGKKIGNPFVAADVVGAGIGEDVLTVSGSTARRIMGSDNVAADAAIVAIIDSLEIQA